MSRDGGAGEATLRNGFTIQRTAQHGVSAQLLGRAGALGNYPVTLLLRATNHGNVDVTNAIARVDGVGTGVLRLTGSLNLSSLVASAGTVAFTSATNAQSASVAGRGLAA